jgi:hypothetical protein
MKIQVVFTYVDVLLSCQLSVGNINLSVNHIQAD